ncbi:DUF2460 domain-containing protein [Allosphingosinicella flava]|uniref:DUF2460 domain-containing protein n=1 Tax=Allosphingosinicella flava TaxID=2771430 RepID=A0A7T2GM56_9SPHN|nr:DUF2460 domain-containing protein [Sphingosinicella flava]QPQ56073.1 DUF2460 domain-containing protein [Sphingosinicella flava]
MGHWLAKPGAARAHGTIKRFDARFWTVNFPRPMMAGVTTIGPNALRADAVFYKADDLAGLIWEAEDRHDHPLLRYETSRDFRACVLKFRWRSGGLKALDAVFGPTLTIEGRDAGGAARAWYVRLWNYAAGSPTDAVVTLDFAKLMDGFSPDGGDPVHAGDIDRLFISLAPPGFTQADQPLGAPQEGWVEMSEIACEGSGSVLGIGETLVPEHDLRIATGYDDLYHLTAARVLRNALHLGYREVINHYVGMSHYFRLEANGGGFYISLAGGTLNAPCAAWHRDFASQAKTLGYEIIFSLSYELLDQHVWNDWKQRTEQGAPALTGWEPPSTLLSPAHDGAMYYLRVVALAFVAIAKAAGQKVRFQVGEPWWWVTAEGKPCLYDQAAWAAFGADIVSIPDVKAPMNAAQKRMLDKAGAMLSASTAALAGIVKWDAPGAETSLLVYLPTVLDKKAPDLKRANVPVGWASPAFDILQLEDYDWVTAGNEGASALGFAEMRQRLGYPVERQHYFSGFVLKPEEKAQWRPIAKAALAARRRGVEDVFVWALPQVMRDGFTYFQEEQPVEAFEDVRFPVAIGREASVEPVFSTQVVTTAGGAEHRTSDWADARLRFDAGPGVRGEAELGELIAFFRARRGQAVAFRFEDPFDHSSNAMTVAPGAGDQLLGIGDGVRTMFPLVKSYDGQERRITRPVSGTVKVSVGGVERVGGWTLAPLGIVQFGEAPATGVTIRAGFRFDVPVRFAEDRLSVSRATFAAGEAASVALIEVREA